MLSLLIETSTERGVVAIVENNDILYCENLPVGYNNSKFLIPYIDKGLKQLGVDPKNFAFIAAGIGPGSYTGIRVGAVAAKTLSFAWEVPLVGVFTLEGFVPDRDCTFAAIIDAKIGGAYVLKGKREDGTVTFSGRPEVLELEKLGVWLKGVEVLVSPITGLLKPKVDKLFPDENWEWQEKAPDPMQMLKGARVKFEKGEFTRDGHLELVYLRKTQAEIERENGKGKRSQ